jgi:hypothetical protein
VQYKPRSARRGWGESVTDARSIEVAPDARTGSRSSVLRLPPVLDATKLGVSALKRHMRHNTQSELSGGNQKSSFMEPNLTCVNCNRCLRTAVHSTAIALRTHVT